MSRDDNWTESVLDRIRDITGGEQWVGADESFSYSISHGYERLVFDNGHGGGLTYQGALHPGDGVCHSKQEFVDESNGICVHCGRTLL